MNPDPKNDELPQEWKDAFRALGAASAPAELADRVALARMEEVKAPAELRDRVELAAFGKATAPTVLKTKVMEEVRREARPILPFRFTLPRAAAAAVLFGVGIVFGPWSGTQAGDPADSPQLAADVEGYAALREAAKREVLLIAQPVDNLDPTARALAAGFGGMLDQEGAQ